MPINFNCIIKEKIVNLQSVLHIILHNKKMKQTPFIEALAWGTDAGFYRLIPKYVIHPSNEEEVKSIFHFAKLNKQHITFRAAGTSLSGQAISNSILAVVGKKWEKYEVIDNGRYIKLQPGIIGGRVNQILSKYGYKFAPDPASIKSAMVGGIISNNASGMSCGIHANSNKMIQSARIILSDGTILDTSSESSKTDFISTHKYFIDKIIEIRDKINKDKEIYDIIKTKYSIKNVTGLNMLPFIEHEDPFDIITHLLVGGEGTLAFISEVTMQNIPILPYTASALIYFKDANNGCKCVIDLKRLGADAVELFDYKALLSVKDQVDDINELPEDTIALLIKIDSSSKEELSNKCNAALQIINKYSTIKQSEFTTDTNLINKYWAIRSGIFPSVGSMRPIGTTCLIEDIAFPIHHIVEATKDLQLLLTKHHYDDAVIYGHALEGNYHFIINQKFETQDDINRYESLMNDVVTMVIDKYNGSLKAEHGTGRNMAPFVKKEWGEKIYSLMKEVKNLFDPDNILNPGVIFNEDSKCHISNIKPLVKCHPLIDKCIECGFCEVNCVTCGFTLSSRQRIVIQREIARLKATNEDDKKLRDLIKDFNYPGNITCAGDGLCSTSCPVKINTGELIHVIREKEIENNKIAQKIGSYSANNLHTIENTLKLGLSVVSGINNIIGDKAMSSIANQLHSISKKIPLWTPSMPKSAYKVETKQKSDLKVVYFPSCINQTMGASKNKYEEKSLQTVTINLLEKAGYEVIFPKNMNNLCCGTIWESKGMPDIAAQKTHELAEALYEATNQGEYPVLCDQSPCLYRMRNNISSLKLYEPVEFILTFLQDKLLFNPIDEVITIHATCSTIKMGLKDELIKLAKLCSNNVVVTEEIGCCAFAGDKGFTHPEINKWALRKLRPQIEKYQITSGYSNSRTCEIGLTTNGGVPFMNIIYLVDRVTTKRKIND